METENSIEKKALVMLSGGRDSFLTVCKLIGEGYCLDLVTYNNGCISSLDNVTLLYNRLLERFGKERIGAHHVESIACEFNMLRKTIEETEIIDLSKQYPHLLLTQLNCLACHTAMYLHAIALCLSYNIKTIAEGAREQQNFFVELPEMRDRYTSLCHYYDIELKLPVYNLDSDYKRKEELSRWGFTPKSYEPQCWVGRPMYSPLTDIQRMDLTNYFDNVIEPMVHKIIADLKPLKTIFNPSKNGYL